MIRDLTEFHEKVVNIEKEVYFNFKMAMIVFALTTLFLGTIALGCIWHFERYGGDPQKRTILNQLIGLLALNNLFGQAPQLLTVSYRLLFGPLTVQMAMWSFIAVTIASSMVILFILDEIILIRWLSVFVWKQLPPINDDFFGMFLTRLNFGLALMFILLGVFCDMPYDNIVYLMTGAFHYKESKLTIRR